MRGASTITIANPAVSHVIYIELTPETPHAWVRLENDRPRQVAVRLAVPEEPRRKLAAPVLVLFVIMMLDVNFDEMRRHFRSYLPVGAAVGALVLLEMVLVILAGAAAAGRPSTQPAPVSNTQALGRLLYVDYVYPFELAAVLLLVAIVAAIALTYRKRRETKTQDPGEQVKVRRADRVRLVSMPSEKRES